MSTVLELVQVARYCAGLFRLGCHIEAALDMVELFMDLIPQFSEGPVLVTGQWSHLLQSMLVCQERKDWLGLADYLEYEVIELLESQCPTS